MSTLDARLFTDIDLSFRINPLSGDITKKKGAEAVKQSVKNLVLTKIGESLWKPYVGSNASAQLFENFGPTLLPQLEKEIENTISQHEPRADIISVVGAFNIDDHSLSITIKFNIINVAEPITVNVVLDRVR